MISWGGERRGWGGEAGKASLEEVCPSRDQESREVSHKGMGKAVKAGSSMCKGPREGAGCVEGRCRVWGPRSGWGWQYEAECGRRSGQRRRGLACSQETPASQMPHCPLG